MKNINKELLNWQNLLHLILTWVKLAELWDFCMIKARNKQNGRNSSEV